MIRPLVQVDGEIQRASLVPLIGRHRHAHVEPHRVGPLGGLDLDDVGAQRGEILRGEGAGPKGGEVDDSDPLERWPVILMRRDPAVEEAARGPKPAALCSPRVGAARGRLR